MMEWEEGAEENEEEEEEAGCVEEACTWGGSVSYTHQKLPTKR